MLELHESLHSQYGICLWTLLAMIVLLIMVALWVLHLYRQNKREYNFEKEVEQRDKERRAARVAATQAAAAAGEILSNETDSAQNTDQIKEVQ